MKRLKSYGLWRPTGKTVVANVPKNEWPEILDHQNDEKPLEKWRQAMKKEKESVLSNCRARENDQPKEDN